MYDKKTKISDEEKNQFKEVMGRISEAANSLGDYDFFNSNTKFIDIYTREDNLTLKKSIKTLYETSTESTPSKSDYKPIGFISKLGK